MIRIAFTWPLTLFEYFEVLSVFYGFSQIGFLCLTLTYLSICFGELYFPTQNLNRMLRICCWGWMRKIKFKRRGLNLLFSNNFNRHIFPALQVKTLRLMERTPFHEQCPFLKRGHTWGELYHLRFGKAGNGSWQLPVSTGYLA